MSSGFKGRCHLTHQPARRMTSDLTKVQFSIVVLSQSNRETCSKYHRNVSHRFPSVFVTFWEDLSAILWVNSNVISFFDGFDRFWQIEKVYWTLGVPQSHPRAIKPPEMNAPRPVDMSRYQVFYPTPSELGDPSKSKSAFFLYKKMHFWWVKWLSPLKPPNLNNYFNVRHHFCAAGEIFLRVFNRYKGGDV